MFEDLSKEHLDGLYNDYYHDERIINILDRISKSNGYGDRESSLLRQMRDLSYGPSENDLIEIAKLVCLSRSYENIDYGNRVLSDNNFQLFTPYSCTERDALSLFVKSRPEECQILNLWPTVKNMRSGRDIPYKGVAFQFLLFARRARKDNNFYRRFAEKYTQRRRKLTHAQLKCISRYHSMYSIQINMGAIKDTEIEICYRSEGGRVTSHLSLKNHQTWYRINVSGSANSIKMLDAYPPGKKWELKEPFRPYVDFYISLFDLGEYGCNIIQEDWS